MRPAGGRRPTWAGRSRVTTTHFSTLVIAGLLGAWAFVAPTISDASAPSASHPLIESVSAVPSTLPAPGGIVTVTAALRHASSCQLELLSHQSFPVVYASNVRPCASTFMAHVIVGSNT